MLLQAVLFEGKKNNNEKSEWQSGESNEIGMKRHFSLRLFMFS